MNETKYDAVDIKNEPNKVKMTSIFSYIELATGVMFVI